MILPQSIGCPRIFVQQNLEGARNQFVQSIFRKKSCRNISKVLHSNVGTQFLPVSKCQFDLGDSNRYPGIDSLSCGFQSRSPISENWTVFHANKSVEPNIAKPTVYETPILNTCGPVENPSTMVSNGMSDGRPQTTPHQDISVWSGFHTTENSETSPFIPSVPENEVQPQRVYFFRKGGSSKAFLATRRPQFVDHDPIALKMSYVVLPSTESNAKPWTTSSIHLPHPQETSSETLPPATPCHTSTLPRHPCSWWSRHAPVRPPGCRWSARRPPPWHWWCLPCRSSKRREGEMGKPSGNQEKSSNWKVEKNLQVLGLTRLAWFIFVGMFGGLKD